jgi:Transcriptional regulator PadR-like family
MNRERLKGNLDLLLLSILAAGPAHGYAIISALRDRSGNAFDLPEGTIYPALHRLEEVRHRNPRRARLVRPGSGGTGVARMRRADHDGIPATRLPATWSSCARICGPRRRPSRGQQTAR